MKLHDLGPDEGSTKRRRRIARGNSGRAGTYAGRGRKGQNQRSGGGKAPYFEGGQLPFVRRLPYRRGFHPTFRVEYLAVNLGRLDQLFDDGDDVTPESLVAAGVIRSADEPYKVLAGGEITKALTIHAPRFSESAAEAIESAGGSAERMPDEFERPGMRRQHKRWS